MKIFHICVIYLEILGFVSSSIGIELEFQSTDQNGEALSLLVAGNLASNHRLSPLCVFDSHKWQYREPTPIYDPKC